jgi:hypothetical protein
MSIQCPYSIGKVPNIFRFETVFMIWPLIAQNLRSVLTNGRLLRLSNQATKYPETNMSTAENGRFSRLDSLDNRPFEKTSTNSISRFWFLVTKRNLCYFELIIVRAERDAVANVV